MTQKYICIFITVSHQKVSMHFSPHSTESSSTQSLCSLVYRETLQFWCLSSYKKYYSKYKLIFYYIAIYFWWSLKLILINYSTWNVKNKLKILRFHCLISYNLCPYTTTILSLRTTNMRAYLHTIITIDLICISGDI